MSELEDLWEFVPTEDAADPAPELSPQEAALHVSPPAEWGRRFDDPARQDVATWEEDAAVYLTLAEEAEARFFAPVPPPQPVAAPTPVRHRRPHRRAARFSSR
jgi:hypothetical protein